MRIIILPVSLMSTHTYTYIPRTDFASICRRYKLNYKQVMDQIGTDGEGRYSLDAFIHYMKRYQHSQAQHSHHQTNYYDQESFTRPTSPIHRPSSAGKHTRQAVYSSASSGHHHTRMSTRYPMSPVAPATAVYNDQETFTPEDHHFSKRRQEMTRTPDVSFILKLLCNHLGEAQYMKIDAMCMYRWLWHCITITTLCTCVPILHFPPGL